MRSFRREFPHVPVVVMTSQTQKELFLDSQELLIDSFFYKGTAADVVFLGHQKGGRVGLPARRCISGRVASDPAAIGSHREETTGGPG
jgi:hypothetical protein